MRRVEPAAVLRAARLERLWSVVVGRGVSIEDQARAIADEAAGALGYAEAVLARVEGDALVALDAGGAPNADRPIASALERRALATSGVFVVLDTACDPDFTETAGTTRSFVTVVFTVHAERLVLTLRSPQPRTEPLVADDWTYLDDVVAALACAVERRQERDRIERLAYNDALTSLPNRLALHARLDETIREAGRSRGRSAVLFLDIDGFKAVNDTVGHRGGDAVLAEIAKRLRSTLRQGEYIGRLGGDEFAIVVAGSGDRVEIAAIAQRIGGVLTFPFAVDGHRFDLSASIGVAVYPDDGVDRVELLASADRAMYAAKEDGGSRIRFCGTPSGSVAPEAIVVRRRTDDRYEAGFTLVYQPIVDLRTGRLCGAEALIRRKHPVVGLLPPEHGWALATEPAARRALDRFVLREALAAARGWQATLPLRIDVNVAAFDLDALRDVLGNADAVDTRLLRIEVGNEQFGDADAERVIAFAERCDALGIGLVLDGFDGGFDHLDSLAHLHIDAIKLDRPLVAGIAVSRASRAIARGSVVAARALGWTVIAKGVETADQYDVLVEIDCDAVQGYYVGRPMAASDFAAWCRRRPAMHEQPA